MQLLERHRHANIYDLGGGMREFVTDKDISNTLPFEGEGVCSPETYLWSDAYQPDPIGRPNIWRLRKGYFGYIINMATGLVKICPVRRRWDVWYSIDPRDTTALTVNQENDRRLELYVDRPKIRRSFYIGVHGLKTNYRLKANYNLGDTFERTFEVITQGLTLEGRRLMYEGRAVARLNKPFMTDATGASFPVTETLNGNLLTLTATGINALTLPVDVDPTLESINALRDAWLYSFAPTTGFGQNAFQQMSEQAGFTIRGVYAWDISPIPVGSPIISSIWTIKIVQVWGDSTKAYTCYRMVTTDWEDAGNGAVNDECNHNNYKDPNMVWPGGVGGLGDIDLTVTGTSNGDELTVGTQEITCLDDIIRDANLNRAGDLNYMMKYDSGTAADDRIKFDSLEGAIPHTLSIIYRAPVKTPIHSFQRVR